MGSSKLGLSCETPKLTCCFEYISFMERPSSKPVCWSCEKPYISDEAWDMLDNGGEWLAISGSAGLMLE